MIIRESDKYENEKEINNKTKNNKNKIIAKLSIPNNLRKTPMIFNYSIKSENEYPYIIDPFKVIYWDLRSKTILNKLCLICGSNKNIEMHHLKPIKYNPKNNNNFKRILSDFSRKQIPICKSCHVKIHSGQYSGKALRNLKPYNK